MQILLHLLLMLNSRYVRRIRRAAGRLVLLLLLLLVLCTVLLLTAGMVRTRLGHLVPTSGPGVMLRAGTSVLLAAGADARS